MGMIEDFSRTMEEVNAELAALSNIATTIRQSGKSLADFGLPEVEELPADPDPDLGLIAQDVAQIRSGSAGSSSTSVRLKSSIIPMRLSSHSCSGLFKSQWVSKKQKVCLNCLGEPTAVTSSNVLSHSSSPSRRPLARQASRKVGYKWSLNVLKNSKEVAPGT
ncbi:uncharacterized protein LOC130653625 [Hydractinia symbiolongicarpus]|uniref:uncharacterized protein LOC130653625 n=1 Tax=Hydractinia symbiolongicarpus TaxID=13093 RepID=UPI00254FB883|nr:uncharacterized protein LOC130653625 [Hydractinia symbiolongicarpus]